MTARSLPENLLEELTCSICVEHLKDPVSIPCGHSFCRACITELCDYHKVKVQDSVSCPVCKKPFQKENISPNWVLAKLVPSLLNLELSDKQSEDSKQPADYQLCKRHGEKTFFYCETDEQFLCLVCRELQEHSNHVVLPVEDAAQPYKDEIQRQLGSLKESKEKVRHLKENNTFQTLLNQIQDKKLRIVSEHQQFREFLDLQEQLLLVHVEELEKDITYKKEQYVTEISQKVSHLEKLINEMEEKASQTPSEILKIRKQLEERWEKVQVLTPFTTSQDLEERVCTFTGKTDALEESMRSFKTPWLQLHLQNKTTNKEICQTVEQILYQLATEIITQSKLKDGEGIISEAEMSEILEMVVLGKLKEFSSKLRMKMKTTPLRIAVIGNASLSNSLISSLHSWTYKAKVQGFSAFENVFPTPLIAELQQLPDIEIYRKSVTTYLKEIDCDHFNVVIIVVSFCIKSIHTSLAIELHNMGKKVYFVSMNIQPFLRLSGEHRPNFRNTKLFVWNLERIRLSNFQAFLISVMNDVSNLQAFYTELKALEGKRRVEAQFLMDFLSHSCVDAVEWKKTVLQGIIGVESLIVAIQISAASGVLSELTTCLSHYRRFFGVDDLSLTSLAQMLGWNIKELQSVTKSWNLQALIKDNQKLSFITDKKVEIEKLDQHSYQKLHNQAHYIHNYFLEVVANDVTTIFQKIQLELFLEAN